MADEDQVAEPKDERVQLIIVIVLAIGAAIFAYFRFFHDKDKAPPISGGVDSVLADMPWQQPREDRGAALLASLQARPYRPVSRDLFASPVTPVVAVVVEPENGEDPATPEPPPRERPDWTLGATGESPGGRIATIAGRVVRVGDELEDYTVVEIGRAHVVLRSRNDEFTLKLEH